MLREASEATQYHTVHWFLCPLMNITTNQTLHALSKGKNEGFCIYQNHLTAILLQAATRSSVSVFPFFLILLFPLFSYYVSPSLGWNLLSVRHFPFTCFSIIPLQVSDDSSDSPEPGPVTCMEPFMVRRLSCRTVQLPPLAFRQAEQYYCDRKPEPDTVTVPPRPTTLPLRTPPLIAITAADTSR